MPLFIEIFWQNRHESPEHQLTWCEKVPLISGKGGFILFFVGFPFSFVIGPLLWLVGLLILVLIIWAAPVAVILLALVLIREYFVCHLHLLKLLLENILVCCWVAIGGGGVCMVLIWIGVVELCHLVISLLDFGLSRLRAHFQNAVKVHVTVFSEWMWELSE